MKLDELFQQIHQIPQIPKIVQELVESFNNDDVDMNEVSGKIALDQVITAKVLRLANSARYSRGGNGISSVDDAVVRLGFSALRTLVVASGVSGAFQDVPTLDKNKFWKNTFFVASAAKELARLIKADAETAFTAGTLYNIGEMMIHLAVPEKIISISAAVQSGGNRSSLQEDLLGLNYTQVGAELAKRWKFPDIMQQAILYSDEPLAAEKFNQIAALLHIATALADALEDTNNEAPCADLPKSVLLKLGITTEQIEEKLEVIQETASEFAEVLS